MKTQISIIAPNVDFKVNLQTGEAYISQRKTAEITGIPRGTIQGWLEIDKREANAKNMPATYNVNENNQLDAKSLQKLVLSGIDKGYEKCTGLVEKLMEAGATAFICHMAGIALNAVTMQPRPLTYIESLEQLLASEKEKETLRIENLKQAITITDKRNITNEGENYFTVSVVKTLNQGMKLSGLLLSRESDDQEIPPVKQHSMYGIVTPNAYHREVWEVVYPGIVLPE